MKRFFFLTHIEDDKIWGLSGCNLLYCGYQEPISLIEGEKYAQKIVRAYIDVWHPYGDTIECLHMLARTWKSAFNKIRKLNKI